MTSERPIDVDLGRPVRSAQRAGFVAASFIALVVVLRWAIDRDGRVVSIDHDVLRWVLEHRGPVLTTWFQLITALGDVRAVGAVGAIGVGVLVARRRRDLALVLVASSSGTWLFVNWLKPLVQRPRPPEAVRLVAASGWSFPSGHAGQGAAMYLALAVLVMLTAHRRSTQVAAIAAGAAAAGLIGLSRVYLGVHWVSDVIAGWSLAIAWLALLLGAVAWCRRVHTEPPVDPVAVSGSDPTEPDSPSSSAEPPRELERPGTPIHRRSRLARSARVAVGSRSAKPPL